MVRQDIEIGLQKFDAHTAGSLREAYPFMLALKNKKYQDWTADKFDSHTAGSLRGAYPLMPSLSAEEKVVGISAAFGKGTRAIRLLMIYCVKLLNYTSTWVTKKCTPATWMSN